MAKEELIEMQGKVEEVLPDSRFRVTLDNGHSLVAYTGGKMRKHHIRILAGDKVSLEVPNTGYSKASAVYRDLGKARDDSYYSGDVLSYPRQELVRLHDSNDISDVHRL